jgi:hypothetical protein
MSSGGSLLAMAEIRRPHSEEVDQLLRNAQLRDELEPFFDESIAMFNNRELPTKVENDFLASMLAWERAPVLPISQWFTPELALPHPESLTAEELHLTLWETIGKLYEQRIVLDFTDHLNDRQLYSLIYRDILPSHEKRIENRNSFLHWDCANTESDPEVWLRYYATDEERTMWSEEQQEELPAVESPPYPRRMPHQDR